MERYVEYLRKSRFDRDYAELSIEETLKRHKEILDKLAKDRGFHIAKVFSEVVSGESIAARPEVQKMLEEVSAGMWDGVLVVDVERLARGNGVDQAYISQVFQFSGTKIITPGKVYDPANEYDEEYFEFGLFMSRREYKTIKRRLIRGRDSSAAEGKWISSLAPYGYRRVKLQGEKGFTLEPDPDEAEVVKKIYEMSLHNAGTKIIANYLNDHKVPTRCGDLWTYSTVSNIIANPTYMGKIRRGWSKQYQTIENGVIKKHIKRARAFGDYPVYEGLHPALVSEEDFMEVQRIRALKAPSPKVRDDFELQNAFVGLMYCSICGKRIGRSTQARSREGRSPRLRCVNARNCHNVSADYDVVEQKIIDALRTWLDGYKVKVETVGFADEIAECRAQVEGLEHEETATQAQMEKAYDLVEQGVYTLELFKARREKLIGNLSKLKEQKAALEEMLTKLESSESSQASLVPNAEALLASYDEMTIAERSQALKTVLRRIEYRKEKSGEIIIDLYPLLPQA